MKNIFIPILLVLCTTISCTPTDEQCVNEPLAKNDSVSDSHSYSNHSEIRTTHIHLDIVHQ